MIGNKEIDITNPKYFDVLKELALKSQFPNYLNMYKVVKKRRKRDGLKRKVKKYGYITMKSINTYLVNFKEKEVIKETIVNGVKSQTVIS